MRVLYCPVFASQGKTLEIWGLVKTPKDMICAPLIKTGLEKFKEFVTRTSQMEVVLLFYTILAQF